MQVLSSCVDGRVWYSSEYALVCDEMIRDETARWRYRTSVCVRIRAIQPGQTVEGKVEIAASAETAKGQVLHGFELFVDGVRRDARRPGNAFDLDTTKLADGWHEIRVVALAGPLLTQGRAVTSINVSNHGAEIELLETPAENVSVKDRVRIRARLENGRAMRVLQNAREVAAIEGEEGTAEIDAAKLGAGPVRLRVTGKTGADGETCVWSEPVDFTITP